MSAPSLTPPEHCHDARVEEAAAWYREHQHDCPRPLVPALRRMFGLTAREAIEALALGGRAAQ